MHVLPRIPVLHWIPVSSRLSHFVLHEERVEPKLENFLLAAELGLVVELELDVAGDGHATVETDDKAGRALAYLVHTTFVQLDTVLVALVAVLAKCLLRYREADVALATREARYGLEDNLANVERDRQVVHVLIDELRVIVNVSGKQWNECYAWPMFINFCKCVYFLNSFVMHQNGSVQLTFDK